MQRFRMCVQLDWYRGGAEGGLEPLRYCYRQPLKLVDLLG